MSAPNPPATGGVLYHERLGPHGAAWLLAPSFGLVAFLLLWPIWEIPGYIAGVLATIGAALLLWFSSPVIRIDAGPKNAQLHAGRVSMPVELLGGAKALDAPAMREAMGPGLSASAFVCHRAWLPTGVIVRVQDPQDPTPYWLISSRAPTRLVDALEQAQAAHSEQTG